MDNYTRIVLGLTDKKRKKLRYFINKENLNQKLHENLVEIVLRLVVN